MSRAELALSELEQALAEVSRDQALESGLRRLLLESDFYVLGEEGDEVAPGQRQVQLVHHTLQARTYLSAYTSLQRIQSVVMGQPYVVLRGGAIFAAVQPDVMLILNLGSWPNRSFTYEEARDMASEWERSLPGHRVEQPEGYPARLLEALWVHFSRTPGVLQAHLAQVREAGKPPRLVVAVRVAASALAEQVLAEAREVARQAHGAEVHLHHLTGDELSQRVLEAGVCFFNTGLGTEPLRLVAC